MQQAVASGTKASAGKGKRKSPTAPVAPAAAGAAAEPDEDPDILEVIDVSPGSRQGAPAPDDAAGEADAAATPDGAQPPDRIVSSNAYMLMYKRRNWRCGTEGQPLELPPECVHEGLPALCFDRQGSAMLSAVWMFTGIPVVPFLKVLPAVTVVAQQAYILALVSDCPGTPARPGNTQETAYVLFEEKVRVDKCATSA